MSLYLADAEATEAAGRALGAVLHAGDVVTLSGPVGAGKTSFARGALAALGLDGEAASPSFPIVIPYATPETRLPVAHVDLYRIDDPSALEELGLDDYLFDGALLVEWPEHGGRALPGPALRLTLSPDPGGGRRLTWQAPAAWGARWPLR
ncbi:tRNA (adenosine(37)-N6)-threonylcarbamoyltransferase complex ATPase subunit type 1 TsaE [Sphingomonas jatrophae]|uniref:tRNA threonylcarbamoyladenosine biosynthesis protein TsaE n=1 Tax=Sphingomonas jatrophae TaxID=1166337 RepID=A0A1I6KYK6_9SPHN|nr:tRNA (adenosine(37)-N6)-threonylcarbamoyltransferase complex ATPase subunit type 1 TsaE [Sphingomonas jatrophae]SFR96316.1 tRNA threonylcarbamoyladenosine biosynthesis protein TsaE [Sphingomonas jatrophae]